MGQTQVDRRYTDAEIAAMEDAPPPSPFGITESPVGLSTELPAASAAVGPPSATESFLKGVTVAPTRLLAGLNQLLAYVPYIGDPAKRAEADAIVKQLEADFAPYGATLAGKAGEIVGTAAPMALLPAAAVATPLRAAATGAAVGLAQPVEPSLGGAEFAARKAGRAALDALAGAAGAKLAQRLTQPRVPPVQPERAALAKEAQSLGLKLTPAQRTGDIMLAQYEEGLKSRPGSAGLLHHTLRQPQERLNEAAAAAVGMPGAKAPTEAVLTEAALKARQAYQPLAQLASIREDAPLRTALTDFYLRQNASVTGSPVAAQMAERLDAALRQGLSGDMFLQELQGVRDAATRAFRGGDVATARELRRLATIMEDRLERAAAQLGPDIFDAFKDARRTYSAIRAIEQAVEPVSGNVSPLKYLNALFRTTAPSRAPSEAEIRRGLTEVGRIARVMRQTQPYIGSSGTAERIAGQQLVEATTSPFSFLRVAPQMAKNYLAAQYYLRYGGPRGGLGLPPTANVFAQRLFPLGAVGLAEASTQ